MPNSAITISVYGKKLKPNRKPTPCTTIGSQPAAAAQGGHAVGVLQDLAVGQIEHGAHEEGIAAAAEREADGKQAEGEEHRTEEGTEVAHAKAEQEISQKQQSAEQQPSGRLRQKSFLNSSRNSSHKSTLPSRTSTMRARSMAHSAAGIVTTGMQQARNSRFRRMSFHAWFQNR